MIFVKNASTNHKSSLLRALRITLGVGLSLPAFLLGCLGPSENASATTAMNVDVTSGMTIRILDKTGTYDISSIDLSLVSNPLGAYVSDNFIVEVATSAPNGYTLYMESDYLVDDTDESSCTNALVHQSNSTYTVPTLAGTISRDDFYHSKSDTSGTSSVNRWGWSSDDTTYKAIPECNSNTVVNSTSEATSSSRLPVYVAANINMDKPAGIYKNTLTFSAIAEPVPISYTLKFNGNTSDTVTNLPTALTGETTASSYSFTIPDTIPTRAGYEFKGWSTTASGPAAGDSGSGDGGLYVSGDNITVVADGWDSQTTQLYAIWTDATDFWSITYMQEMTPTICGTVYTPAKTGTTIVTSKDSYTATANGTAQVPQRTLTDSRDGKSYTIRKLADGNCWMTSNLALALVADKTYADYGYNYLTDTTFDLSTGKACSNNGTCIINGNTPSTGGFYSWYAATAGKGTATQTAGDDVPSSICPKGWRLPPNYTVEPNKSYSGLLVAYGMSETSTHTNYVPTLEAIPLSFLRAGRHVNGSLYYVGQFGHYWSSTASSAGNAYNLFYDTTGTTPQAPLSNYFGFSIRCVSR